MKPAAGPVGLISNPTSGHNRDQFDGIHSTIAQYPGIHHRITHSQADIADALRDLAALDVRVLAINGGDGTVSAILGELLEREFFATPPLIAVLPGGTANMNAGDIGVRGSLNKAVERFCQWSEGDRETADRIAQRALMRVVIDTTQPARYGMFLGGGAVVHGLRDLSPAKCIDVFRDGSRLGVQPRRPARFRTESDCEVILPLWLEHGVGDLDNMFSRLSGMYAFCLYDEDHERSLN